jgi:hypothetical protein
MITSGNLLLRVMTMRSKIGFGIYKDLCVQELCQLFKHAELIKMYYHLDKIDFDAEVKEELGIKYERVIQKPGKDYAMYKKHIWQMIEDIQEMNRTFHKDNPNRFFLLHQKKAAINHFKVSNCIRQNKEKSKIHNRTRNQKGF